MASDGKDWGRLGRERLRKYNDAFGCTRRDLAGVLAEYERVPGERRA